jgi:hypothetical protein
MDATQKEKAMSPRLAGWTHPWRALPALAALLLAFATLQAHGQSVGSFGDQIVVRPATPRSTGQFEIDVPAGACLMSHPTPYVATSSLAVSAGSIEIRVTQAPWACFSAGDPYVFKPLTFAVGPLAAGSYVIDYVLTSQGLADVRRSASVTVTADAQVYLLPAQPRPQEDVRLRVGQGTIGQVFGRTGNWHYDPDSLAVSMAGNRITVDFRMVFNDFSASLPSQALDVPIGRFPAGTYEAEMTIRDPEGAVAVRVPVATFSVAAMTGVRALNHGGLWWTPSESGWGLNVVQHGDTLFASWFVYGPERRPVWYFLSDARWVQSSKAYEGIIYRSTGPEFRDCYDGDCPRPFDPAAVERIAVGSGRLAFTAQGVADFFFTIDGRTVRKRVERFTF